MLGLGKRGDAARNGAADRGTQVRQRRERQLASSRYDAFISYSHALDGQLAPAVQVEVERFAKPWYHARARRLFRDNANLSAAPQLWNAIEAALASSTWFVLLASPEAAHSEWVDKEVDWWLRNRGLDRILIVLTDGELAWQPDSGRVDAARTTALPPSLVAFMGHEPRWVDLRWMHDTDQVNPANPQFRDCVADIAATISQIPKDTLVGEHVRRRRQTMRWVRTVIASLTVLLVTAASSAVVAAVQRNTAREQTLTATSRQLVAEATSIQDSQPNLARQLLAQAYRLAPTDQAVGALFGSSLIPRVIQTSGLSRRVAYSPRRDVLAVASDQGVTLYDSATLTALATLGGQRGAVGAIAFSQDDRLLAIGGAADGIVRLWDVTKARRPVLLAAVRVATDGIENLAFSSRAPVLAISVGPAAIAILDIRNRRAPEMVATIPGFPTAGSDDGLAVSPDGGVMASSGENHTVRLWDLSKPSAPTLLTTVDGPGRAIAFSPDGQLLVSGGDDNTTRLWDVADPAHPRQRATLAGQSLGIDAVAFAADGATLATGAGDSTIQLWNLADPIRPTQGARLTGHSDSIAALAFSGDGRTLASASADGAATASDGTSKENGTVRLWSVIGSDRSAALARLASAAGFSPAFSPDGRTMASGFPTTLWDLSDRARPRTLATVPTFSQGNPAVAFSPDGQTLAAGVPVALWDVADRTHPRALTSRARITEGAQVISFNPVAPVLATGTEAVRLWDLSRPERPTLLATLGASRAAAQGVAFRWDGRILATLSADGAVQLWNVAQPSEPELQATFKPTQGTVKVLAFSPSGRTLLTGGATGIITAWDVQDPSRVRQLGSAGRHTGGIDGLAFHPGGTIAASASEDGTIRLWNASDPSHPIELIALFGGGRLDSALLSFSPDGRTLAAASGNDIQLWDVDLLGTLQRLCAQSPPISRADWAQYLPDRPYDPPCA